MSIHTPYYYHHWHQPMHPWGMTWGQPWNPYPYGWNQLSWQENWNNNWSNHWNQPYHNPAPYKEIKDYGPDPLVINIEEAAKRNHTFRTALWTGKHLQVTLMSIPVGEDIGLEIHPNLDQFIRIEEGQGLVQMGERRDKWDLQQHVEDDDAVVIPAGTWHNLINTGNRPLKLYSIYAPPQHPRGTVHETKAKALAAEEIHQ